MLENKPKHILACDIGGTHITSAIVCCEDWSVVSETICRTMLNSQENAKSILQTWSGNIKKCLQSWSQPINQIGIAMPGPFDYENGVSLMEGQSKYDSLYMTNITKGLLLELNNSAIEIRYINDAAAFLQGEIFALARERESSILGITLGTGLGSAVWKNGKKAFDAELWNNAYLDGIFEEYLATRWFTKRFAELQDVSLPGLKEIIIHYSETPSFLQLMDEYRTHLLNFLTFFQKANNCNAFIIGGNIAKAWQYIDSANYFSNFNIELGQHEEKAALIGAASLFL